jgi:hypothetical protein
VPAPPVIRHDLAAPAARAEVPAAEGSLQHHGTPAPADGLAVESPGMPTRRIRKRCQVTLAPDTIAELHDRVLRARAGGEWSNLSREVDRAVREATGNLVTARREVLRLAQPLRLQLRDLRQQLYSGRPIRAQDLDRLAAAVESIATRLEPAPAPAAPNAGKSPQPGKPSAVPANP